jgi:flagellar hook-basal body complex protein FliE
MFIDNIKPINAAQINELNKAKEKTNELPFKSVFDTAIENYKNAEAEVDNDIYKLSTGETDDLHNLMINVQKRKLL